MNIKHFLSLLRWESRLLRLLLPLAAYMTFIEIWSQQQDVMFSLRQSPGVGFVWFLIGYACVGFFSSPYWRLQLGASFEFLFSLAISKGQLFGAKASLFLLVCFMQPLIVLIYSYSAPLLRVELPYHTLERREETKRFYLEQFSGSYLEKDQLDREGNKFYVVLPQGQTSVAWLNLLIVLAATFTIQGFTFLFWRIRFGFLILVGLYLLSQVLSARLGFASHGPSRYEAALAWSQTHLTLALLVILAAGVAVQFFALQRFRSTELV